MARANDLVVTPFRSAYLNSPLGPYMDLNREVIAKKGKDYIGDKSRWFWFGDHGILFTPGSGPA